MLVAKPLAFVGLLATVALAACGTHEPGGMSGPTMGGLHREGPRHPLESNAILQRSEKTGEAMVKHILIGWKDLDTVYDKMDPRAAARTQKQAEALVEDLLSKLASGAVFEALQIQYSEDAGSAKSARPYLVNATAKLEKRFIQLSLRLETGEWGVVRTTYGFHIIKRVR